MNPFLSKLILLLNSLQFDSLDYQIAKSLLENWNQIGCMTSSQIADICQVSVPKLLKFLNANGLRDVKDLKTQA